MTCEESQNLISARLDNELPDEDRANLDAHLSACAACRAVSDALALQDADLRRAFARRRRAAHAIEAQVLAALPRTSRRTIPWLPMLLSAAAGFALAFGLFHSRLTDRIAIQPASQPATQPAPIAQLALATGAVEFLCPGDAHWSPMATGGSVPAGTQVRTGPDVRCEFHTPGGSEIRLNANTQVRLGTSSGFELLSGEVWSNVQHAISFEAKSGDVSCVAGSFHPQVCQFDLTAQPKAVTLTVLQGPVHLAVAGGDQTNLSTGEQATVTDGHLGDKSPAHDLALATRWVNEILVLKGRDNPELATRINDLLAQIGQQKMGFMFEEEIRALGDHSVVPLTKYIQSDRSKADPASRAIAARIVSDVAPQWAIPNLIELLQDRDGEVRAYAAIGLRRLTRHDFGRSPEQWQQDDPILCQPTASKWRTWWNENHDRYPGAPPTKLPELKQPPVAKERIELKKG